MCVWGGVANSFSSPSKGWPHHPPVLRSEPPPTPTRPGSRPVLKDHSLFRNFQILCPSPAPVPSTAPQGTRIKYKVQSMASEVQRDWAAASLLAPALSPPACPVQT